MTVQINGVENPKLTAQTTGWTGAGGTTSKTLTVTADTSLDEAVAMSSKAPKTDVIKGDGTAGRVLRSISVWIQDGTNAGTLKCKSISLWNGDANGDQDNITKGATTGVWRLSADGIHITLDDAGITGDTVAILSCDVADNETTTVLYFQPSVSTGINLQSRNSSGVSQDLTVHVDTGVIIVHVLYLTTA